MKHPSAFLFSPGEHEGRVFLFPALASPQPCRDGQTGAPREQSSLKVLHAGNVPWNHFSITPPVLLLKFYSPLITPRFLKLLVGFVCKYWLSSGALRGVGELQEDRATRSSDPSPWCLHPSEEDFSCKDFQIPGGICPRVTGAFTG